jgi:processive 1,2-diacylglycerol beta-glucosyltransferase
VKIVILTAATGNGHISAAHAIREEAEARGVTAPVIDVLDHTPKAFRKWFKNGYEMLVRQSPDTWGYLYRRSDKPSSEYYVQTFLDHYCTLPLAKVLDELRPDWVICTHSVAQPRLKRLRKRFGFKVAVVVTDLYPHKMWLRGRPDLWLVPGQWTKDILAQRVPGSESQTVVTGIPINRLFAEHMGREAARAKLGLAPNDQMILLTSGGIGGGPLVETAEALSKIGAKIITVCGRHDGKRRRLHKMQLPNVVVKGHVEQEEMATLMQACDMMVAKAGGLTTCESLAVGCPFIVYWPLLIPGQEEGNAEFLDETGAGKICRTPEDLVQTVQDLLANPERLTKMSEIGRSLAQPTAATLIVDEISQRTS